MATKLSETGGGAKLTSILQEGGWRFGTDCASSHVTMLERPILYNLVKKARKVKRMGAISHSHSLKRSMIEGSCIWDLVSAQEHSYIGGAKRLRAGNESQWHWKACNLSHPLTCLGVVRIARTFLRGCFFLSSASGLSKVAAAGWVTATLRLLAASPTSAPVTAVALSGPAMVES